MKCFWGTKDKSSGELKKYHKNGVHQLNTEGEEEVEKKKGEGGGVKHVQRISKRISMGEEETEKKRES